MQNHFIICLCLCLFAGLGGCQEKETRDPETGVSRELARQRKADIRSLRYELSFRIPEKKEEEVTGQVKILFAQTERQTVVLDFREDPEKVKVVKVNGQAAEVRIVNEHIVVPAQYLVEGANEIEIGFVAGNQSLNRNEEYLYTLLVPERARTLFPCFDQPDLKATFALQLDIPEEWVAVANASIRKQYFEGDRKKLVFGETHPLSTYLFAFLAGRWQQTEAKRDGRKVALYYRETDPAKIKQIPAIFDQVFASLKWLEEYTDMPYPFEKYDLVIVPGFQFGGMEHAGAVLYNDKRMFLGQHPTVEEELGRMELIAHETAHQWFGDAVTMEWFDDVWTKEVFANYFAARMTEPQFPQVNHRLNELRNFYVSAYSEDRTAGSNAVKQHLGNLKDAGLIYGQIVYNKAPVVMKMLVERMGEEAFRKGIREYLQTYAYGNATWEKLITILDKHTPEALAHWSHIWVNEKGMPEITLTRENGQLALCQQDPWQRGMVWPQQVEVSLLDLSPQGVRVTESLRVDVTDSLNYVPVKTTGKYVLPNLDGKAYGYFGLDAVTADFCLKHLSRLTDPVARLSSIITLNENRLCRQLDGREFALALLELLKTEQDPLIISTAVTYVKITTLQGRAAGDKEIEQGLLALARQSANPGCRLAAFRALTGVFTLPETTDLLYRVWKDKKPFPGLTLGENDYIRLAYELAIRLPGKYDELREEQLARITDPDRQREFGFIVRAVVSEQAARDSLFCSLLSAENRRIEPWVNQMMYYLNHPLRQGEALKYIIPALEEMEEIQRTGDIFFPKNWVAACLRGHNSGEAAAEVRRFLQQRPDYPQLLKNKILQSADHLLRLETNSTTIRTGGKVKDYE